MQQESRKPVADQHGSPIAPDRLSTYLGCFLSHLADGFLRKLRISIDQLENKQPRADNAVTRQRKNV